MPVDRSQEIPVNVVGSSEFGVYPNIDLQKTINMYITDGTLATYSGYKKRSVIGGGGKARGLFTSYRGKFMLTVIGTSVYRIDPGLGATFIKNISTSTGKVKMAENYNQQICIVDGYQAYIYSYAGVPSLTTQVLTGVIPNYVDFHNGFFLLGSAEASTDSFKWYAAKYDTATTIIIDPNDQFRISTKPDVALAVVRLPGKGNNVLVFGHIVAELWTQVGGSENYRRVSSSNINTGTVSVDSIATSDDVVAWLGQNEKNAPVIMVTDGSNTREISTDGISNRLEQLVAPEQCTGFIYKIRGHLFYQITFYHPDDNLTLFYDFKTEKFFHATDENQNYYPALDVAYFENKTYFVSLNDNCLYEMSPSFGEYNYSISDPNAGVMMPQIRITKTLRKENTDRFRIGCFKFWCEQGNNTNYKITGDIPIPRIDMSFSTDGNESFSNIVGFDLNALANRRGMVFWNQLGQANEVCFQLRFVGKQVFLAENGVAEVY